MANLRTCSRCKCTIDESYFSINRKKEYYKTCDNCRNRNKKTNNIEIKVESESDAESAEKLEEEWMTTFYKEHKYPSYEEVVEIIKSDLTLFSEYGEFNHTLLNKIWDEMGAKGNEEKIKL